MDVSKWIHSVVASCIVTQHLHNKEVPVNTTVDKTHILLQLFS
jgi:hypothetical protein